MVWARPSCGRFITASLGYPAWAVALGLSAFISYASAVMQSTPEPVIAWVPWITTQHAIGVLLVLADVFAALALAKMFDHIEDRSYGMAILSGVICLLASVTALSNHVEFAYSQRVNSNQTRTQQDDIYQRKVADLARLELRRNAVEVVPPLDQVRADIARYMAHPLYVRADRTDRCTPLKTTASESIRHCDELRGLEVQEKRAEDRDKLDQEIAAVRVDLAISKRVVAGDVLAEMAQALFGINEQTTSRSVPAMKIVSLFAIVTFGLSMLRRKRALAPVAAPPVTASAEQPAVVQRPSMAVLAPDQSRTEPDAVLPLAEPEPTPVRAVPARPKIVALPKPALTPMQGVSQWAMTVEPGVHLLADLQPTYDAYCGAFGIPKVPANRFGTALRDLGYQTRKNRKKGGKIEVAFPKDAECGDEDGDERMMRTA